MEKGDVTLSQDNKMNESDKRISLTYQRGNNLISKVISKQKTYHYCVCRKKNYLIHHAAVLILLEDRVKNNCFIYCISSINEKITYTTKDYDVFVKIYGWIELNIIKPIQAYKQRRLKINFKGNVEPQWDIQFESTEIRDKWFLNIDHFVQRLKQIKEQDKSDPKEEEMKSHFQYSNYKKINQLLNSQFDNVKNILKGLLHDTDLDKQYKTLYLNDKLNLFQANFQVIAHQIQVIESTFVTQIQKNKQAFKDNGLKMQNLLSQINELKQANEKLSKLVQEDNINKINVLQELSSKLSQEKTVLQNNVLEMKSSKEALQNTSSNIHETLKKEIEMLNQQLKKETQAHRLQILKCQRLLAEKEKMMEAINQQLRKKDILIQDYAKRAQIAEQQITRYKHASLLAQQLQSQIVRLKNKCRQTELFHIFQGQILDRRPNYKQYMREQIEGYTKNNIATTKILYKFDRVNKINFHTYVDNHRNIVLIIKTSNGSHLAAFSEDPFSPNVVATRGGLIFSLTNNKTFYLLQQKRSVSYDEYYLIFGNSQIRIKSLQERVFSNFGITNGFYGSNGLKVDILLNDDANREVDIDQYEVHEIFFKP